MLKEYGIDKYGGMENTANNFKIKTNCPLCNSDKLNIQFYLNSETAAQHLQDRHQDEKRYLQIQSKIENIWGRKSCAFLVCTECSFGFAFPFIAGDKDLYSLIYDHLEAYPKWKWEYQLTYNALESIIGHENLPDTKFLEIGAGNGAFIRKIAPDMIKKNNVICTEYSAAGQVELENYGIKCLAKDIRDDFFLDFPGYFEVVCVFQVLEHLDNLKEFFNRIDLITKEHADIFIAVPNDQMRKFYDSLSCYLDVPPVHLTRWNIKSFDHIAQNYGWVIKDYQTEPQSYPSKLIGHLRIMYYRTRMYTLIKSLRISLLRKFLHIIAGLVYVLIHLREIFALKSKNLGISQWIHIQKDELNILSK